jgi:acetyl esterase/lipase
VAILTLLRLAPEHPFPTGINDCWDTLKWLAHNAASLGANPKAGFIIGGASAGGNLSAVIAHIARDEKLDPPLTGQYLCVPAVVPPVSVPEKYKAEYISPRENTKDPVLQLSPGDRLYAGLEAILKMDMLSPLFNPMENPNGHRGLPRAYFQICGLDPLRDEGLIYEQVLSQNGVETKLTLYPGFGHMFWTNYPHMERSKQFVKDTLGGIRWLLSAGTG